MSCYEPTPANGSESFDWQDSNDEDTTTITTPADPGGGLLRVKLTAFDTDLTPTVTIVNINAPDGAAIHAGQEHVRGREDAFRAQTMPLGRVQGEGEAAAPTQRRAGFPGSNFLGAEARGYLRGGERTCADTTETTHGLHGQKGSR